MIGHVVMWKFREDADRAQIEAFLDATRALYGVLPQLKSAAVRTDCNDVGNYDAILLSTFDSLEDLAAYQVDPRHQAVIALCKPICASRTCVDYEV